MYQTNGAEMTPAPACPTMKRLTQPMEDMKCIRLKYPAAPLRRSPLRFWMESLPRNGLSRMVGSSIKSGCWRPTTNVSLRQKAAIRADIGSPLHLVGQFTRGADNFRVLGTYYDEVGERAGQLRRLAALFEGYDNPLMRLLQPDNEDDGRTARNLLGSALAAVEAGEDLRRE